MEIPYEEKYIQISLPSKALCLKENNLLFEQIRTYYLLHVYVK